eukprot:5179879-Heterocapsa_arctica.AAC.1
MTQDEIMELSEAILISKAEEESRNQWSMDTGNLEPTPCPASATPSAIDRPAGQKDDYCVTKVCTRCRAFYLPPGPSHGICSTCGNLVSGP